MMAMLEVFTKPLPVKDMQHIIERAKGAASFKAQRRTSGVWTFSVARPPDLGGYEFDPFSFITSRHTSRSWSMDFLNEYLTCLHKCEPYLASSIAGLEIAESGRPFDPDEESDVRLLFGCDQDGAFIRLSVGAASPGHKDLRYRQKLFSGFVGALGLADDLEAVLSQDVLTLQTKSDRLFYPPMDPPFDYDTTRRNLVKLCVYQLGNKNPSDFALYCFSEDQLGDKIADLIRIYGESKVIGSDISFRCKPKNYTRVREVLNGSLFAPWTVQFAGTPRYGLDRLDNMIAEHDSFLLHAFDLKPPGIGKLGVDLDYSEGEFTFHFYGEYKSDKQERALGKLVVDLAGGRDIIDRAV